jgi:hypothetical protein
VEKTPEQAVALLADRADAREHAVERHAEQEQRMRREHQAALEDLGHDLGRARVEQLVELAVVDRAHDDRELGPARVHLVQDLERERHVGERDDDGARAREPGGAERVAPARVAVDDARAAARGLAHAVRVVVERDERDVLGLEQAREVLAAAPVAARR